MSSNNNLMFMDRVRDHSYTFNDLMLKKGGSMPSKISIQPVKESAYTLMMSPLAMKMGGLVDAGLYTNVQSIGFGNKTYLSSI